VKHYIEQRNRRVQTRCVWRWRCLPWRTVASSSSSDST